MRRSRFFCPVYKESPKEAQVISHQLMLRAGMIEQSSAGIYSWLPLGLRVLRLIEQIIREEQDKIGAQEILMPTIQSAELWRESGRYEAYGEEMLRIKDRHERDLLYSPTAEELITDIARHHLKSYRDLPQCWYQIQWKFRDEIRPRFGVMRGREFFMKDAYSIDLDAQTARASYMNMMRAYVNTFRRLGLTAVPVKADTGPIGGDLSHEFHVVAKTGESALFYEKRLEDLMQNTNIDVPVDDIMSIYAAADEMHKPEECPVPEADLRTARGIEVGHIFYFGEKYSRALGLKITGPDNSEIIPHMGSYGIGVSRLVAAIIEASHDDQGIIWPHSVAPFQVGIISIKEEDTATRETCERLYNTLQDMGLRVLYDDRKDRPGFKFAEQDLLGLPLQVRVGPKGLEANEVEVKDRKTGEIKMIPVDGICSYLKEQFQSFLPKL